MSSRVPDLSIVIPCYNYARFLPDCLDSIFSQSNPPDFEVVIVDDGSTDNTGDVLDRIRDPRVHIVRHARETAERIRRTLARWARRFWGDPVPDSGTDPPRIGRWDGIAPDCGRESGQVGRRTRSSRWMTSRATPAGRSLVR